MKRSSILALVIALSGTLLATLASAQEEVGDEGGADLRIESVDLDAYPAVRLAVRIPALPDGPPPTSSFRLFEDGVEREAQVDYARTSDLQIVLLIDTTGSMGGLPLTGAKEAASLFVERLPDDVGVSIVSYDVEATVLTDFEAARSDHLDAIEGLAADGSTAMYDAVRTAVEIFPDASPDTARAIVLLTDGEDNASESSVDEAIADLVDAEVTLHSVEYLTAFSDEAAIRSMAESTGGEVREAADADSLLEVYDGLAATLVSRFTILYESERSGDTEVAVQIDHPQLQASDSRTLSLPEPAEPAEPAEEVDPGSTESAPTPPAAEPPPPSASTGSPFGRAALYGGASLWFLGLALATALFLVPRAGRAQISTASRLPRPAQRGLTHLADRASLALDRGLERRGYQGRLNGSLERAGLALRPGEFIVLIISGAVTAGAVGRLLQGWVSAILLALVAVLAGRVILSVLTSRRQRRFAEQLGETLQLLAGSLRAGYSFLQALDAVAREADSPAAEEFGRLVVETRLGREVPDSLHAMADRMGSDDFRWVTQAIEIHREVGGDLAEVLDNVAGTIRERGRIRRQVAALSAEGRLSAWVLIALPFGVGFFIFLTNRPYIAELTSGGMLGWGLLATGAVLMTVGTLWIRQLVRIEF